MWALQDARLADGTRADIVVDGERIAQVGRGGAEGVPDRVDCSGKLLLPAFIDGHVHLDKALIRDELREHDGTLAGAIGAIHERKRRYTADDVRARARAVIEDSVRLGTTRLRSHVDVDTIGGLVPLAGVRTLEMVADEALARGYIGRVCAGHVCSLSAADHAYAERVIEKCRRAEISIAANPVTNLVLQGRGDRGLIRRGTTRIGELREAGVNVLFGQDCVKDGFYPFGRGSMLEVALISAHAAHLTTRDDLDFALRAVTQAPALAMRLSDYGLTPGSRADMQLLPVPTWSEALRLQPLPEKVWYRGRLVAENSVRSEVYRR